MFCFWIVSFFVGKEAFVPEIGKSLLVIVFFSTIITITIALIFLKMKNNKIAQIECFTITAYFSQFFF